LAGVSDQLIRRALQRGELPRRYVQTTCGLQLVFQRAALQRWIAGRRAPRRRRAAVRVMPAPAVLPVTLLDALQQLGRTLAQAQAAMANVSAQLAQQQDQLTGLGEAISGLAAQLAALEAAADARSPRAVCADRHC
jgi:septal ring factor EnvC (AmiA/AmiB activator)